MKKLVLGYVNGSEFGYHTGLRVDVEINLVRKERGLILSICGNIWKPKKDDVVQCGQIQDTIRELIRDDCFVDYCIPVDTINTLLNVWDRWHLNDVKAGCEHQRAEEWDKKRIDENKPINSYGKHYEGQIMNSWNMWGWIPEKDHPNGLLGKPCNTCGYKYGSSWLIEPLPEEVVAFIRSL